MDSNVLKKYLLNTLFVAGFFFTTQAQVNFIWSSFTTEPDKSAVGSFLTVGPDGNIIQVGHTDAGGGDLDYYAAKYDTTGNLLWHTAFHSTYDDNAPLDDVRGIALDADGNLYISGTSESASFHDNDLLVIRIDADGTFNWSYEISISNLYPSAGYNLAVGTNGILYVAGRYEERMVLVRFDLDGNYIGMSTVEGQYLGVGTNLVLDDQNNVYMCGKIDENDGLAKFDSEGNLLWNRVISAENNGNNYFWNIAMNHDQSVLYTGGSIWAGYPPDGTGIDEAFAGYDVDGNQQFYNQWDYMQNSESDVKLRLDSNDNICTMTSTFTDPKITFITKYNSSGDMQWKTTLDSIGGNNYHDLFIAPQDYIVCVGDSSSVCILDNDGNIISVQSLEPAVPWTAIAMVPDDNTSLYFCGTGNSVQGGPDEMRLDKMGGFPWVDYSGIADHKNHPELLVNVYPNPVKDNLYFNLPSGTNLKEIEIFDESGRLVESENTSLVTLNVTQLEKGIYSIDFIDTNGKKYNSRFLKN